MSYKQASTHNSALRKSDDKYIIINYLNDIFKAYNYGDHVDSAMFFVIMNKLEKIPIFTKIDIDGNTEIGNMGKLLGSGNYGKIYVVEDENGDLFIMKIPLLIKENSRETDQENTIRICNFMEECIFHLLFEYYHSSIQKYISDSFRFEKPFPEIKLIACGTTLTVQDKGLRTKLPFYVIEKLDMTLYDYIKNVLPTYPKDEQIYELSSVLLQVCSNVYILQKTTRFMHRDMHPANIMLKRDDGDFEVVYNSEYNNTVMIKRKFRTYIIDLGQSCAQLYCCGIKPTIYGTSVKKSLYESKDDDTYMFNISHDLRCLLAYIYFSIDQKFIPEHISKYIKSILSSYTPQIDVAINEKLIEEQSHYFYKDVITTVDPNFFPESIIITLFSMNSLIDSN